ncbi:hypothetical protein L3Q82_001619 [Scortum barcoo]|uniref:Uncharacterized protein n=1 Tax=Scortum barcoo TaxID=214431 RepID=A0ACB8W4F3_9TELE|nr:hypothetical protein L3Q82_001619 [Scortum barcoo]
MDSTGTGRPKQATARSTGVPQVSGCCGAVLAETPLDSTSGMANQGGGPSTGGSHFSLSPGKVYARVLERRIQLIVKPLIQEEQCGFHPARGTLDQLYTLHRVLEGLWEFAQPVHMCFVLCVHRGILWGVLHEYGVQGPLLRAGAWFALPAISHTCSQCMLQGCPLSPVLFIIFMDRISRRSQGPEGVQFGNHRISSLLFADDIVLLASSNQDLQHVLERFAAKCEAAGMRIKQIQIRGHGS